MSLVSKERSGETAMVHFVLGSLFFSLHTEQDKGPSCDCYTVVS